MTGGVAHEMERSAGRGPAPSWRAVLMIALSAAALLATSPASPHVTATAMGEVTLGPGEHADRTLHVHLEPASNSPTSGRVAVELRSANSLWALGPALQDGPAVGLVAASDANGPFDVADPLTERCRQGCDLSYTIRITGGRRSLPASVVRYDVAATFEYPYFGDVPASLLAVTLEGSSELPVAPLAAILAALLALVGGIVLGPRVDRRLGRRRQWTARALVVLALGGIAWVVTFDASWLVPLLANGTSARFDVLNLLVALDPLGIAFFGIIGWGVLRGIRRWPDDDGWRLGLAATAAAVIGSAGLWTALTSGPEVQPLGLCLFLAIPAAVGGTVLGQAWRGDREPQGPRVAGAAAVISHGVIAFACAAWSLDQLGYSLYETNALAALPLLPAILVMLAFRRWIGGRSRLLVVVDILLIPIGLGAAALLLLLHHAFGTPVTVGDYALVTAVAVVPMVATATALRPPRREAADGEGPSQPGATPSGDGPSSGEPMPHLDPGPAASSGGGLSSS